MKTKLTEKEAQELAHQKVLDKVRTFKTVEDLHNYFDPILERHFRVHEFSEEELEKDGHGRYAIKAAVFYEYERLLQAQGDWPTDDELELMLKEEDDE